MKEYWERFKQLEKAPQMMMVAVAIVIIAAVIQLFR